MHEQDDDYVVYHLSDDRLSVHKEKILQAEPKDVEPFGISQRTVQSSGHG
jgi:hypothetical protein